mgnify:CR=1 FL=1
MDAMNIEAIQPEQGFAAEMLAKATTTTVFLKSLSHPSRLVVLCRLAEGPANVGELESMLNLAQAEVSKQLARLRADKLVTTRRDGRNGHTRPAPAFSRRRGGPRRPRNSPAAAPPADIHPPEERPAGSTARTGLARNTFPVAIAFLQARSTNRSANA